MANKRIKNIKNKFYKITNKFITFAPKIQKKMITHLVGKIVEKSPTYAVIDCNGVGYMVHISLQTYSKLPDNGQVKIYTYLQVKEDAHSLFGFFEPFERQIFSSLLLVSGVGANTARVMLSSLSANQIQQAIINSDVATIQSVKGIGAKTAQRIILDLREKMMKLYQEITPETPNSSLNKTAEDAILALEGLGYQRKPTEKIVQKIITQTPDISLENIIKQALKLL